MVDTTKHLSHVVADEMCDLIKQSEQSGVETLRKKEKHKNGSVFRFIFRKKRQGHFIAMASINDTTPIAESADFDAVCEKAEQEGVGDPIFDYIPGKNEVLGLGHTH